MSHHHQLCCDEYLAVSRRTVLRDGLATTLSWLTSGLTPAVGYLPRVRLADPHTGTRGDTLICIFLRGGADGLNIVVPYGDEGYYQQRPTIGIARPDDKLSPFPALDLDGFFGLHPSLNLLTPLYQAGHMAFVQATGSPDETRSHFEAMDLMERGAVEGQYSGWLARHLNTLDTGNNSALRAIGVGDMLPASLLGVINGTALRSLGDYRLDGEAEQAQKWQKLLQQLYNGDDKLLRSSAGQAFSALEVLQKLAGEAYVPRGRAYADHDFGQALKTIAQLIRADVGVEVACVDLGGWDTHVAQGGGEGPMARLLAQLGEGLSALYEDLAPELDKITVVVMSEFGRRVQENAGLGTDHGHGNMMMVVGGHVQGGKVFANWPGLHPDQLTGPGDLHITIDYRDILGEILRTRLKNPQVQEVFAGYTIQERGLVY